MAIRAAMIGPMWRRQMLSSLLGSMVVEQFDANVGNVNGKKEPH